MDYCCSSVFCNCINIMPLFGKKTDKISDYKAKLEYKLYLARETPEPVFDLSNCALKSVPTGIFSLCKVFRKEYLYLQENVLYSLDGGGDLADLSLLVELDLHGNLFTKLPAEIKLMKSLKVLKLSNNQLKHLPEEIGELRNLNVLDLSKNLLKDIPESIGKLINLQTLDLQDNKHLFHLPKSLCHCKRLRNLIVDTEILTWPPKDVTLRGTACVLEYLSSACGNLSYHGDEAENAEMSLNNELSSVTSYETELEEREKNFKAKILQLDILKEHKQNERLALEKEIEHQKQMELELHSAKQVTKEKLLDDIVKQQSKLESEIYKVQLDREIERTRLVQQLQQVENTINSKISQLLESGACERNSNQLRQLLEQERQQEEILLTVKQEEYMDVRQREILKAMEDILAAEYKRKEKLKQYEIGRAEATRTLLNQSVESEKLLMGVLTVNDRSRDSLIASLLQNEELQREAVRTLLERGDMRSWSLVQQVTLVSSQLSAITSLEMDKRKFHLAEQVSQLCEKRRALSNLLMNLIAQQTERQKQLSHTLQKMEKCRCMGTEANSDFWLLQYQRLLDSRPANIIELEQHIDPTLGQHLVLTGVIHCLPFLAKWILNPNELEHISDSDLVEVGIKSPEDRSGILKAIHQFLLERKTSNTDSASATETFPTAPSILDDPSFGSMPTAECIICMERESAVVFVPCGHMGCCVSCADLVSDCPLCRNVINQKIRIIVP